MAVTEVYPGIYRIGVPLPGSPLRELGCYLIKGAPGGRSLMVDTGFNRDECEQAVREALRELGVRMEETDIFLTHLHADHTGLCGRLKTPDTRVFIRACDGARVNGFLTQEYWDRMMAWQPPMGVPEEERLDYHNHPAYVNRVDHPIDFTDVDDGARFDVGDYHFEAVDLAGHTPGQLGLWERGQGLLLAGDHVLAKITPNICIWDYDNDYLGIYLRNLRKVKTMGLTRILSAHRQVIDDPEARIDELTAHHARRCDEICTLLDRWGEGTVWRLAHAMHWDYGKGGFAEFPPNQKWFGSLEVFAHVEHLRRIEKIARETRGDAFVYRVLH